MKKWILALLPLVMGVLALAACSSDEELPDYTGSPLVGAWKSPNLELTFYENATGVMVYYVQDDSSTATPAAQPAASDQATPTPHTVHFTYVYNAGNNRLTLTSAQGVAAYQVNELTTQHLVLTDEDGVQVTLDKQSANTDSENTPSTDKAQ